MARDPFKPYNSAFDPNRSAVPAPAPVARPTKKKKKGDGFHGLDWLTPDFWEKVHPPAPARPTPRAPAPIQNEGQLRQVQQRAADTGPGQMFSSYADALLSSAARPENKGMVYMGVQAGHAQRSTAMEDTPSGSRRSGKTFKTHDEPIWMSLADANAEYLKWDDGTRAKFRQSLIDRGIITAGGDKDNVMDIRTFWEALVKESAKWSGDYRHTGGKVKALTPWDVLDTYGGGKGGKGAAGKTATDVSYEDVVTSPLAAKSLLNRALTDALGRSATPAEVDQFTKTLNAKQKASPRKTVTTTTQDASGGRTSHSTTSGGFSDTEAAQMALDDAQQNPEYGPFQAVGTYFPAFMQALKSPV